MSLHEYRFRTSWHVAAPAELVFREVTDVSGYPRWWPDVRSVLRLDDDTAEVVCRAMLPYRIVIRLHRVEEDPDAGRLCVRLTGDLDGSLRAWVREHADGTVLEIVQEVVARKPLLRWCALVARPVFRLNHAVMMNRGHRGLRAHLAP
ncbi:MULTISPECIES: SRPBCC family protein [Thermocrispum]|mgnify:CR=1 FL=1|uniref:Polyketide cyclase n=1 Tax=Thermocrispum agreste TaxID=37925 RepID=A0A2W4JLE8_9PSEU|nr:MULTISPECIES: SRPBCC family protein [Thermocrispum]PZM99982.1 MAG: polyketide cyclase [Thermocrispum agreste]